LWHCAATLENQVLKLSSPEFELVPRSSFGGDCFAVIDLVFEVAVEMWFMNGL
jgi:hypothetical protein